MLIISDDDPFSANSTDVSYFVDKQFSANSTDVDSRVSRESVSPDSSSGCFEGWLG